MEQMNICLTSDNNYAELCSLLMISILNNNENCYKCNFYIIDNNINEDNKNNIEKAIEGRNANIVYLQQFDLNKELGFQIDVGRWTSSSLQRIFLCRMLPESVEKILYLDDDMIVRHSLKELYETRLDDYIIAGVQDCVCAKNRTNIGMKEDSLYINAGMLLIDVAKWREFDFEEKAIDFVKKYNKKLQYLDQDIINAVLDGYICEVHPKFNSYSLIFNYSYEEAIYYRNAKKYFSSEEYEAAKRDPYIVHFTSDALSIRPWYTNGSHVYRDDLLSIKNDSLWASKEMIVYKESIKNMLKRKIYYILSRRLSLFIASCVNKRHIK